MNDFVDEHFFFLSFLCFLGRNLGLPGESLISSRNIILYIQTCLSRSHFVFQGQKGEPGDITYVSNI